MGSQALISIQMMMIQLMGTNRTKMLILVLQEHCRPKESERILFRNWQFPVFLDAGIGTVFSEDLGIPRNNCSSALETPPRMHIACTKGRKIALVTGDPVTGEVYMSSEAHFVAAAIILNEEDDARSSRKTGSRSSMLAPDSPASRGASSL